MARRTYTVEVSYMYEGTEVKHAGGNRAEAYAAFNDLAKTHTAHDTMVELSVWENGVIVEYTDDVRTPTLEAGTALSRVI